MVAEPRNTEFLQPGDLGTIVAIEDEDEDDLWFTVRDGTGETDEYCEADLVLAAAAAEKESAPQAKAKPDNRTKEKVKEKDVFDVQESSDDDTVSSDEPPRAQAPRPAALNPRSIHAVDFADEVEDREFDDDLFGNPGGSTSEEEAAPAPAPAPPAAAAPAAPAPAPAAAAAGVKWSSAFDDAGADSTDSDDEAQAASQAKAKADSARASLAALMDDTSDDGSLFD